MMIQYVLSTAEVKAVYNKLKELRQIALASRDVNDMEANREYYLLAKGFEECLQILQLEHKKYRN